MREFLINFFGVTCGVALVALSIFLLFSDIHEVDRAIIAWKASIFGAP